MKILISAYACEPHRGSEPGAGWNLAQQIAKSHDVWVLTSHEHESAILAELSRDPGPSPHFEFVDPGYGLDSSMRGRAIPWRAYLHAYAWQIAAYLRARSLHETIGFDVIHHVTYVRYYTPSFLSLLPVPFMWGPVGGGETAPLSFWRDFGIRGLTHETLRTAARRLGELDPFVRMTARRSTLARATTMETARRLRKIGARNIEVFPEQGLSEAEIQALARKQGAESELEGTGVFLSVARLLHWKGIHLGLRAFAIARMPGIEYWIVGTGPERARLESLARRLGIASTVRFMGELSREEVLGLLGHSLALVHPSLHDSGGVVCIESMGAGKPVICLNTGGPATQVTPSTGFLIPATTPQECIRGIASAMRALAQDEQLREELGQNALRHTRELFSWEERGRLVSGVYEQLVARSLEDREG